MSVDFSQFRRDCRGASLVEFSIVVFFFLVLCLGTVDFTVGWYQWNSAAKALQAGARLAAVSHPVAGDLSTLSGLSDGVIPGDPMPFFERICNVDGCTGGGDAFSESALNTIVYGRDGKCGNWGDDAPGMCDIFRRIEPKNVVVTYRHTGLGFAGRPGGAVPTITVELRGLTYQYAFLSGLLGFRSVTIPPMRTTATGEDMYTTWPPPPIVN